MCRLRFGRFGKYLQTSGKAGHLYEAAFAIRAKHGAKIRPRATAAIERSPFLRAFLANSKKRTSFERMESARDSVAYREPYEFAGD